MAGKLTDDQIRWVLSLDAKGVQGELVQLSSSTEKLTQENNKLKAELRDAEKFMNSTAHEMKKLEAAGKTSSERYRELQASMASSKGEIESYNQQIADNNKAMEENKNKYEGIIETMNVSDMTMTQLRKRANELQTQLNNTSLAADPDAYKKLQEELQAVRGRMGEVSTANQGMLSKFSSLPGPAGAAANSLQGVATAMKALIANPVGIIIMAIAAAFMALKTAIAGSDSERTKFQGWLQAAGSLLDTFKRVVIETIGLLSSLVTFDFKGVKEHATNLVGLGKNMAGNAKAAYDAAIAEDALNDAIARNNDLTAVNKARIAELRQVVDDTTKSFEERQKASEELLKLEEQNYKMSLSNITGQYNVFATNQKNLIDAMKRASGEQFAEVEKYMQMVQEGTELTYEQRLELANLVNDITSTLDSGTEEDKETFRQFFVDLSSMQEEYFSNSHRDMKKHHALDEEQKKKQKEGAKKALEKRLKEEENILNAEIILLKKKRVEGTLTEVDYNKQVEQLTIASLNKKLKIKGQEKDAILKLEQEILDVQLKQKEQEKKENEEADKKLLETLNRTKDAQLRVIDDKKNKKLEALQEEEKDEKIYALRAAEIEANAATLRMEFLKKFNDTVQNAEFKVAENRAKAIENSAEEIVKAEEVSLKNQSNLRKIYAKTDADFFKQFNVKTWEQRKKEELDELKRLLDEKLISQEAYLLAVNDLETRYQDEKQKIRDKYELTDMATQYETEMKQLQEFHEKGLLSEEEFQEAKLQMKIKYAQKYAKKESELRQTLGNVVNALEEAQTANISAEYTKRQTNLQTQFDKGLISAEEYNSQKEQLDYEQRVKELETQKKYADVNFAIQVSQIIASGAVAAINAYSAMAMIPYVGPALGALAAAAVAVTAGLQVSKAKSERDRVKAMTIEAPGGSEAQTKTAQRTVVPGFAEGGYTGDGGRNEPAGVVHRGEYVVAQPEMRNPVAMQHVNALEDMRLQRIGKTSSQTRGYADGGYVDEQSSTNSELLLLIRKNIELLDDLKKNGISATSTISLHELNDKQKRLDNSIRAGSK
ncbi:MAG: SHOCT domain-containing protein [Prevotellaceae bacterium]|nr:SHOCT domain-containing protein [Prevotellaceae bacterium]